MKTICRTFNRVVVPPSSSESPQHNQQNHLKKSITPPDTTGELLKKIFNLHKFGPNFFSIQLHYLTTNDFQKHQHTTDFHTLWNLLFFI